MRCIRMAQPKGVWVVSGRMISKNTVASRMFLWSEDGNTWNYSSDSYGGFTVQSGIGIYYGISNNIRNVQGTLFSSGDTGYGLSNGITIGISTDGKIWDEYVDLVNKDPDYIISDIVYGDRWVAVGNITRFKQIPTNDPNYLSGFIQVTTYFASLLLYSYDRKVWFDGGIQLKATINCAAYNSGRWVLGLLLSEIPYQACMKWSDNFVDWYDVSGGFERYCYSITYANNLWVAVGTNMSNNFENPTSTIKWSDDGKIWYDSSGLYFRTSGQRVEYGNGKWVATGSVTGTDLSGNPYGMDMSGNIIAEVDQSGNYLPESSSLLWSSDGKTWNLPVGGHYVYPPGGAFYNGARWVSPGSIDFAATSGGTIKWSSNGINWYDSSGMPELWSTSTGVTFLPYSDPPAHWVAVGKQPPIIYSYNNREWYPAVNNTDISGGDYTCVAYGNGRWVAAGKIANTANVAYSNNGISWVKISGSPFASIATTLTITSIAYGNKIWVLVGSVATSPRIFWSSNGTSWYDASGYDASGYNPTSVACDYTGNWICVGGNVITYSTDGKLWNSVVTNKSRVGITYGTNIWVSVGTSIDWSYNGTEWNDASGAVGSFQLNKVTFEANNWFALGKNNSGGIIFNSIDGKVWSVTNNYGTGIPTHISYGDGSFVLTRDTSGIIGASGTVQYSTDLNTFYDASGRFATTGRSVSHYHERIPIKSKWIVLGQTASFSGNLYSYDGYSMFPLTIDNFTGRKLASDNFSRYVAVGTGSGRSSILHSIDGVSWYDASGSFNDGYGIVYGNNTWIAVGDNPTILYSFNGKDWYEPQGVYFDGGQCNDVAYDGKGTFVAVGSGSGYGSSILYSHDGITWNDSINGFGIVGRVKTGKGVAYGMNSWVAVGSDSVIKYSRNGEKWIDAINGFTVDGIAVAYGNNTWVAVGTDVDIDSSGEQLATNHTCIKWSPNGLSWYIAYEDPNGISSLRDVTFGDNRWIAVGIDGVLSSSDGKQWYHEPFISHYPEYNSVLYIPSTPNPPCFATGTHILTPKGYKPVESLVDGDIVITAEKHRVPVKVYSYFIEKTTVENAPYRIEANALGNQLPKKTLNLSPLHAIKDARGIWQIPKYLAQHNKNVIQHGIGDSMTYYHIECPNYYNDNLIADAATVESYKNKQGSTGITYIWRDDLLGWERLPPNKMPTIPLSPSTYMIHST